MEHDNENPADAGGCRDCAKAQRISQQVGKNYPHRDVENCAGDGDGAASGTSEEADKGIAYKTETIEPGVRPYVELDQMHLLEYFLTQPEVWSIVPVSAAQKLENKLTVKRICLEEAPSDRYIYMIRRQLERQSHVEAFFTILNQHLQSLEDVEAY